MSVSVQVYVSLAHPLAVDTFGQPTLVLADGDCRVLVSGERPEQADWLRDAAEKLQAAADKVDADYAQSQRDLAATREERARLRGEQT